MRGDGKTGTRVPDHWVVLRLGKSRVGDRWGSESGSHGLSKGEKWLGKRVGGGQKGMGGWRCKSLGLRDRQSIMTHGTINWAAATAMGMMLDSFPPFGP